MTQRGIVLFGHGSRDPLWRKPIEAVAARVHALDGAVAVRCAYLELTEPDLATTVDALLAQGIQSITIVPMFLGVGKHAREDLPALLDSLCKRHPTTNFHLQPSVGERPALIELLANTALEIPSDCTHNLT
jgi:sirohydrochlorin cobaltochelatase